MIWEQDVAHQVLQQLHGQRQSIDQAGRKQQDINSNLTQAQTILGRMGRWFS